MHLRTAAHCLPPQARTGDPPFIATGTGHLSYMGDDRVRVTFTFSGVLEVHYLSGVPEVGDFVRRRHELWVVRKIEPTGIDLWVTCDLAQPLETKFQASAT